jgi:hypothetical protein
MTVRVVHCGTGLTGTDPAVVAARPAHLAAADLPDHVRSDG